MCTCWACLCVCTHTHTQLHSPTGPAHNSQSPPGSEGGGKDPQGGPRARQEAARRQEMGEEPRMQKGGERKLEKGKQVSQGAGRPQRGERASPQYPNPQGCPQETAPRTLHLVLTRNPVSPGGLRVVTGEAAPPVPLWGSAIGPHTPDRTPHHPSSQPHRPIWPGSPHPQQSACTHPSFKESHRSQFKA